MCESKTKSYSPMKTLKRLLLLGKEFIPFFILLCVAASMRSMLGIADTESLRRMINGATQSNLALVKSGLFIGMIALGGGLVLDFIIDYYGEILNFVSTRQLQSKIVRKLTSIQMIKYEGYHSGDLIDRLDNCASAAQTGLNSNVRMILEKSLVIIFSLAYLTYLNFTLMISTVAFMLLLPAIVNPLAQVMRKQYDERQRLRVQKDSFVQDSFQGGEVTRSFSLSERLKAMYRKKYNEFLALVKKTLVLEGFMFNTHFIIIIGGDFFILGMGAYLVSRGTMQVGSVLAFLIMFEKIMEPISRLAGVWPQLQSAISSANKVFEILDLSEEEIVDSKMNSGGIDIREAVKKSEIVIDNVRFGYKDDLEVLKGLSFTCEPDKATALVGPSGGGKSTILKMLIRLYEPSSGSITCAGIPINGIGPSEWRKFTAYVSQDPLLFSGTIYDNICYGNENVTEKEVIAAAKAANIHEVIMNIPDGYKARIGEQGIRLSGGERQRISIARAILRNPALLILDEPTSALDSENEKTIQEALEKLMEGRTTIIVAHRLSTIQSADKIVFIEDGIVQEQGNHQELMERQGKYNSMYEMVRQTGELSLGSGNMEEVAV